MRGKPIARIVPEGERWATRLQELMAEGVVDWSGRRLQPMVPVAKLQGRITVSKLLLEDRE